jgi:hypothetical protein
MRGRIVVVPLAVLGLALAGCGSTGPGATTARTKTFTSQSRASVPRKVAYTVNLGTFSEGSPNGSGHAVITVNTAGRKLCWNFSHLANVTAPTVARIFAYIPSGSGTHGLRLGNHFTSAGCLAEPLALLEVLATHPHGFDVSIHDAQFPGGAVRGQL